MEACKHWTQRGGNKTTKNKHVSSLMRSHPNDKNSHRCLKKSGTRFSIQWFKASFSPSKVTYLLGTLGTHPLELHRSPSTYRRPWVNWVRCRNCKPRRLPVFLGMTGMTGMGWNFHPWHHSRNIGYIYIYMYTPHIYIYICIYIAYVYNYGIYDVYIISTESLLSQFWMASQLDWHHGLHGLHGLLSPRRIGGFWGKPEGFWSNHHRLQESRIPKPIPSMRLDAVFRDTLIWRKFVGQCKCALALYIHI